MATSVETPRILIVDDNRDVLSSIRRCLRRTGYELVCVDRPELAVEHLTSESFDLLLSDLDMPGLTGHDVMAAARAAQPNMIRVFVTGAGSLDAAVRAINEGEVHRFVRKPFDATELRELVHEAIARKGELDVAAEASSRARRRRLLFAQLEAEHPGITSAARVEGSYVVDNRRAVAAAERAGLDAFLS